MHLYGSVCTGAKLTLAKWQTNTFLHLKTVCFLCALDSVSSVPALLISKRVLGKSPWTEQLIYCKLQMNEWERARGSALVGPCIRQTWRGWKQRVLVVGVRGNPGSPPRARSTHTPGRGSSPWELGQHVRETSATLAHLILNGLSCPGYFILECMWMPLCSPTLCCITRLSVLAAHGAADGLGRGDAAARCSQLQPSSVRFSELECKPGGPSLRPERRNLQVRQNTNTTMS